MYIQYKLYVVWISKLDGREGLAGVATNAQDWEVCSCLEEQSFETDNTGKNEWY